MTPANELIVYGEVGLFHVDTITGALSWFFGVPPWPNWPHTHGLVTVDGTTFYTISLITPFYPGTDTLYAMNISNGIISNLGKTSYPASFGDLTLFNGEIYYTTSLNNNPNQYGIVKLDISNPGNSALVASLPAGPRLVGLSASKYCNTLVAITHAEDEFVLVNLIDGAVMVKCEPSESEKLNLLTSMQE